MATARAVLLLCLAALASAAPHQPTPTPAPAASLWKDTPLEDVVRDLKEECALDPQSLACVKYKLLNFVDQLMTKDDFQVSDAVSLVRAPAGEARGAEPEGEGEGGLLRRAAAFVSAHALRVHLPGGAALTASAARLDRGLVDLALDLGDARPAARGSDVSEARRHKLKKIIIPVLVLVLLKAITLVPLFIGALGLKAWNALQLSFFSFAISVGMAIFQLCRKLAADSALPHVVPAPVAAPAGWEPHYGRGFGAGAGPELAFRAHAPADKQHGD